MLISYEKAKSKPNTVWIDVRTPSEYREGTIPGAMNVPLFTDEERAEIGTIYKKIGPEAAKDRGLEIVSPKLPALMKQIEQATRENEAVLFCWRGGMRSKSLTQVAQLMGLPVYQLGGGYRSFRKDVSHTLETADMDCRFIVIHGNTGVGKTLLLQKLKVKGFPVLDLEELAAHRGSIFGHIGLKEPHTQKTFDALLYAELHALKDKPFIFMEAESKRIGRVYMPEFLFKAKEDGVHVLVTASIENQVKRIIEEYTAAGGEENKESFYEAFYKIRNRLPEDIASEIEQSLQAWNLEPVVQLLLTHYYNPRYKHARESYADITRIINANDLDFATDELVSLYHQLSQEANHPIN